MTEDQCISTPPVPMEVHEIFVDRIQESKGNPRRTFDEAKLRELAENIKVHGVLQPVLVRSLPGGQDGTFELVADLTPAVQTAFYESRLTVAHALEIARLQSTDQERALAECFPGHKSVKAILKDRKAEAVSVRELREWIEREIHLDLKNAPFDARDANLQPTAGPCTMCPKRTGNNPLLFPEIRNKSLCTDPACYKAKVQAFVQLRVKPLADQGQKPLQVSEVPYWQAHTKTPNTLYEGQYRRTEREGECPNTQVAVVVDGRKAGTILHICTGEKCKTHRRVSRYEVSPQEREQRRQIALAARIQKEARFRILWEQRGTHLWRGR